MKRPYLTALVLGAGAMLMNGTAVYASSHREAPFISQNPKVDGTDFYMFNSYEPGRAGYVTLVANYQPLEEPGAGPNYYTMDPNALYEIHIDNTGDAKEDITFQFRFKNTLNNASLPVGGKDVPIPLINAGQISPTDQSKLNVAETYTVTMVKGDRRTGTPSAITNAAGGGNTFIKPVDNIGNKSIPNYAAYASNYIYNVNIPGCSSPARVFVGQRKDPFVVNLGETFDLINYNPLGATNGRKDSLANKNVTSLIMEVPATCLTAAADKPVIGGWTTASLRQARLLNPTPSYDLPEKAGGAWTQVSRLGMPLVNELIIGVKDKNRFNSSKPMNDAQFINYVTNPTLPTLIQALYPSAPAPTNYPRNDLVTAFLTGIPGVNQLAQVTPSEMLRLNTSTPVTAAGSQSNLGVIGGDNAGFPNGRRPGDDVVDITLRVAMGKLCKLNIGCVPTDAPAGDAALTDGAYVDSSFFDTAFPYIKAPIAGSPAL